MREQTKPKLSDNYDSGRGKKKQESKQSNKAKKLAARSKGNKKCEANYAKPNLTDPQLSNVKHKNESKQFEALQNKAEKSIKSKTSRINKQSKQIRTPRENKPSQSR